MLAYPREIAITHVNPPCGMINYFTGHISIVFIKLNLKHSLPCWRILQFRRMSNLSIEFWQEVPIKD